MIIDIIRQKKRIVLTLAVLCIGGARAAYGAESTEEASDTDTENIYEYLKSIQIKNLKGGEKSKEALLLKMIFKNTLVISVKELPENLKDIGKKDENKRFSKQKNTHYITVWGLLSSLQEKNLINEGKGIIQNSNDAIINILQRFGEKTIIKGISKEKIKGYLGNYTDLFLQDLNQGGTAEQKLPKELTSYNEVAVNATIDNFVEIMSSEFSTEDNSKKWNALYYIFIGFAVGLFLGIIAGVVSSASDDELKTKKKKKKKKKESDDDIEEEDEQ